MDSRLTSGGCLVDNWREGGVEISGGIQDIQFKPTKLLMWLIFYLVNSSVSVKKNLSALLISMSSLSCLWLGIDLNEALLSSVLNLSLE